MKFLVFKVHAAVAIQNIISGEVSRKSPDLIISISIEI